MTTIRTSVPILDALKGVRTPCPPLWFMRQAGRYLPEYRKLRKKIPDFLSFCLTPELTVEATLQPIRRFGFDAAILFSDILVVPYALGTDVAFSEGRGPVLEPTRSKRAVDALRPDGIETRLAPVYDAVAALKGELPPETALIGFAGAPWTVAAYMVEGSGGTNFPTVRTWMFEEPKLFSALMDILVDATVVHLSRQIEHGAQIVQLFDSWAGILSETQFRACVIAPTRRIVKRLKKRFSHIPIIGFPRGAGSLYRDYAKETGVDGLSLDPAVPLEWTAKNLQPLCTVQGNLDNYLLVAGGKMLDRETRRIVTTLGKRPFVFNLGHGILPTTPIAHVERVIDLVRCGRA